MASEVAQPEAPTVDNVHQARQEGEDAQMTNGSPPSEAPASILQQNASAFNENRDLSSLQIADPPMNLKESAAPESDPTPLRSTADPVEPVVSGIEPVSSFMPKEASSHPTPPPEPPVDSGTDLDAVMEDATDAGASTVESKPEVVHEANGVSFVENSHANGEDNIDALPAVSLEARQSPTMSPPSAPIPDQVAGVVRLREDDPEAEEERVVKRTKTEAQLEAEAADVPPKSILDDVDEKMVLPEVESKALAPEESSAVANPLATEPETQSEVRPSTESAALSTAVPPAVPAEPDGAAVATQPARTEAQYCTKPMTAPQKVALIEKMKNIKKTKHSILFAKPVDYVTLNIPNYPDIIKQPMDLSTMESRLKSDQYASVQEFADDFDLILSNTRKFNGPDHPVTQNGNSMDAYFRKMMQTIPSPDVTQPSKSKKKSPPASKAPSRRESRSAIPAASPSVKTNGDGPVAVSGRASVGGAGAVNSAGATGRETFALQSDGTPQIRRDSTMNRPARAIKPPANREVAYPKPKRKEHQLELKFCEAALDKMRSPELGQANSAFLVPVDPVALNIPHYRQIVKNPMDLGTMAQKLKTGQYGKANEFQKDFDLMIQNCLSFNPHGNPVRDMAVHLKREFHTFWSQKAQWEKRNAPASQRESPVSGDESSSESGSDDDDQPDDGNEQTIAKLSAQLADIQKALLGTQMKQAQKNKEKKAQKKSHKKKAPSIPLAKPAKPAPKKKASKPRQVTYDEKQEISSAVERMDQQQVERLTQIITDNCKRYADMGDDMELEIDDLPNDVQLLLLKHVRSIFGKPQTSRASPDDLAAADDDDFEPEKMPRGSGGAKGGNKKKHKPMGKKEQIDKISSIKQQLAQYEGPSGGESLSMGGGGGSGAGYGKADSSGDESEESEEE